MPRPDLFHYQDYRSYLDALYRFGKEEKKYSYRKLAADLGLKPSNYLHLVIRGRRNLSLKALRKVKSIFDSPKERDFFETLVLKGQSESAQEVREKGGKLKMIRGDHVKTLGEGQLSYFARWYFPVIREIISLAGFVSNLSWISRKLRPHIPQDEVRQAMTDLEKMGFIKTEKGRWMQSDEHLQTGQEVTSDALFAYHRQMLELAMRSLLKDDPEERDISSMTLAVSPRQFGRLKKRLHEFREELRREIENTEEKHSLVCQVQIQLFQVTEK
ncbi:MAG: TIGR02147 family protein [Deltaproteobacteria bacterium]|nr:TIGR02147 family protein [Deltaproteobacteria bacterium]